jgi:hypothetical protein
MWNHHCKAVVPTVVVLQAGMSQCCTLPDNAVEKENGMSKVFHETAARERYARNVRKAQMQDLLGMATGKDTNLLSFEEVTKRLGVRQEVGRRIEIVPVEKIIGSVGRYSDFTREFLPRPRVDSDRWARLDAALNALEPVPPVELYKISDVYFVKDH